MSVRSVAVLVALAAAALLATVSPAAAYYTGPHAEITAETPGLSNTAGMTFEWDRLRRATWSLSREACAQAYSEHPRDLRHDLDGSFGISLYSGRWAGQGDPPLGAVPGPGGSLLNLRAVVRRYFKPRFVPLVLRGRTVFRAASRGALSWAAPRPGRSRGCSRACACRSRRPATESPAVAARGRPAARQRARDLQQPAREPLARGRPARLHAPDTGLACLGSYIATVDDLEEVEESNEVNNTRGSEPVVC